SSGARRSRAPPGTAKRSSFRRSRAGLGLGPRPWTSMALRPRTLKTTLRRVNQNAHDAATHLGPRCPFRKDKAPAKAWVLASSLQSSPHRREGHIQLRAEPRKRGDDGDRHADCDQRVSDGAGAAILACEARRKHSHDPKLHRSFGAVASQSAACSDIVARFAKIARNSFFSVP